MGTVQDWLESNRHGDIALVLEFDGMDLVVHSAGHDESGIATAWAATDWTTFKPGLRVPSGEIADRIEPFSGQFTPQSMTFSMVDSDGSIVAALLGTNAATERATLAANVDADDTELTTVESGAFSDPLDVHVGLEAIHVETQTGSTLSPCTRGYYSTFGTATSDRRGRPHRLDTETDYKPRVTSSPSTHTNRIVSLWLTRWNGSSWATRAESVRLWAGRIKGIEDRVGEVAVRALDLREMLNKTLLGDQFTGQISDGLYLTNYLASFTVSITAGGTVYPTLEATLDGVGTFVTHEEIASAIAAQLQTWSAGGSSAWPGTSTMDLVREPTYGFYVFRFTGSTSTTAYSVRIGLHTFVWEMLGLYSSAYAVDQDSTGRVVRLADMGAGIAPATLALYTMEQPQSRAVSFDPGTTFSVEGTRGTWHDQPNSTSDGFLKVGNCLYEVNEAAGVFTVVRRVVDFRLDDSLLDEPSTVTGDAVTVKQIWFETGTLGHVFYGLAVSTGTADYAVADDDCYPEAMGCGVPYGALDRTSWMGLGTGVGAQYTLVLEEPKSFRDILQKALSTINAHVVVSQGVIRIVRGVGAASSEEAIVTLDSTNTAREHHGGALPPPTRTKAGYGIDGIINRVTLKYHRLIGGDTFARRVVVNAVASQTDHDMTRGLSVEAEGFYGGIDGCDETTDSVAAVWLSDVVAAVLAYCSQPYTVIPRSFAFPLATVLYPGATVLLTDPSVLDPATATRGVTNKAVWVAAVGFNWQTGVGEVELLLSPNAPTIRSWAPSALVDHAATSGGYVAGTKTLTLEAHAYSGSGEAADASHFAAGDIVRVIQVSPAAAPKEWLDTVVSVSGNDVVLTTGLSSPAWDASLYYVLTLADDDEATAADLAAHAFVGVDGHAWGPVSQPVTAAALDTTSLYRKLSGAEASDGEPLSVHKLADAARWAANFASHGAAQVVLTEMWATRREVTGDSYTLVAGPIPLPVTSVGKSWKLSVLGKETTGEGYVRITTSEQQPTGISDTAVTVAGPTTSEVVDVVGTSDAWSDGAGIVPTRRGTAAGLLTWVTVEAKASGAGETVSLRGLTLREVPA